VYADGVVELLRPHSPAAHGQMYDKELQDLREDPKESEITNKSLSSGTKADASSTC
jgi:hypothetical protein